MKKLGVQAGCAERGRLPHSSVLGAAIAVDICARAGLVDVLKVVTVQAHRLFLDVAETLSASSRVPGVSCVHEIGASIQRQITDDREVESSAV